MATGFVREKFLVHCGIGAETACRQDHATRTPMVWRLSEVDHRALDALLAFTKFTSRASNATGTCGNAAVNRAGDQRMPIHEARPRA